MPDDMLQVLELHNCYWPGHLWSWVLCFNRAALKLMCDFCRINILAKFSATPVRGANLSARRVRELLKGLARNLRGHSTSKLWPIVLLALFLGSLFVLTVNTYYRYIYDANTVKLRKLQEFLNTSADNFQTAPINLERARQFHRQFHSNSERARSVLSAIGALNLSWRYAFLVQTVISIYILPLVVGFFIIPLRHQLDGWLLLAPRSLIDREAECRARAQLTIAELNRFALDSLSFAISEMDQLCEHLKATAQARLEFQLQRTLEKVAIVLRARHRKTIRQLRAAALAGRLNQPNRTRARCNRLALCHAAWCVSLLIYCQGSLLYAFYHWITLTDGPGGRSWRDILEALNLLFVMAQSVSAATVAMTLFVIVLYDLLESICLLRKLVLELNRSNERLFDESLKRAGVEKKIGYEIELNLLTVLMQTRIMKRSLALALEPLNTVAFWIILFAVATPLVFKLHSAYFSSQLLKSLSSQVGLLAAATCFALLIPLGRLHQCCRRCLLAHWDLVAQVSYFELAASSDRWCLRMQTSVVVVTLRRELSDARQTASRMACRVFSIPVTNGNITRAAFWVFLAFALLSRDVHWSGADVGLARLARDPFNLFGFLSELSSGQSVSGALEFS